MSEHRATIYWQYAGTDFVRGKYSREHVWEFDGGIRIAASPSPSVVPAPHSNAANVDPEEAFVAAVSSCHMMSFLYIASKAGVAVTSYRDEAVGVLTKNTAGKYWISKVTLHPQIEYADSLPPGAEQIQHLHHAAHEECYIANSINTEVVVAENDERLNAE
jgi:organic hydroperoxide reductase OsmC/OhrA